MTTDYSALRQQQTLMTTNIVDGPHRDDGRPLDEDHAPLRISIADHRRAGTHVTECRQDAGVADVQDRVGAALGQARGSILAQQS